MFSPYGPLECTSAQSRRRAPAYAAAYRASRASHDSGGSPTAALAAFCERRNCVAAAGRGRRLAPTWTWPQQSRNPTTRSREKGTLEFTMTELKCRIIMVVVPRALGGFLSCYPAVVLG
ncbi:hypothetical protein ZIOFF_015111 [Zingiber officinale]|uniref:Uncharacterized protein n=1 Tax=Zingiber officinale TaxID=94328 RepID=A0A8J5HQT7_ZINOF|nr:hypothetical protein ZIOFF_015111 [Zingiber officinale]